MKFTLLAFAALVITTSSFASSMVCHTIVSQGGEEVLNTNFVPVSGSSEIVLTEFKNIKTTIRKGSPRIYFNEQLVGSSENLELSADIADGKGNEYDVLVECSL